VVCKEVVVHVADVLLMPASPCRFVNAVIARRKLPRNGFGLRKIESPRAQRDPERTANRFV
jgi:hypothetical protein